MPRPRSFIDAERIRKAGTLHRVEPIYEHLAVALAAIPALRVVKLFPGRQSASNRLSTDGKKNPVVAVGAGGITGVELLVDAEAHIVQFYAITSAEQGVGRQIVDAVVGRLAPCRPDGLERRVLGAHGGRLSPPAGVMKHRTQLWEPSRVGSGSRGPRAGTRLSCRLIRRRTDVLVIGAVLYVRTPFPLSLKRRSA